MVDIDVGGLRIDRSGSNQTTLDQLMGDVLEKVPVLEGPRLMFTGIADEVSLRHAMIEHLFPLDTSGKTRSTPPA